MEKGETEESRKRKKKKSKVKVLEGELFPFLDMKMKWRQGKLLFQVHKKEGQQLKYVDSQSTHRPSAFRSITNRVLKRLSQLTSNLEDLKKVGIDK
eukprot:11907685-Ditylum_brightwellii.AAC.1